MNINQITNHCQISFNSLLYLALKIYFENSFSIDRDNKCSNRYYYMHCLHLFIVCSSQSIAEQHYRLYESNQYERGANQATKDTSHQFVTLVLTKLSMVETKPFKKYKIT